MPIGQSTPYHWISEDHGDYDTYTALHPRADVKNKTELGGGFAPIQYEEERARMDQSNLARGQNYLDDAGFRNLLSQTTTVFDGDLTQYAPTTEAMVFDPDMSYDQWLFEVLRRDPGWVNNYWDAENETWQAVDRTNLMGPNHVYSGLTRNDDTWLPGQINDLFMGLLHPGTNFATAQQLTNYAFDYDNPARRRIWEYQQNEARYMNNYIDLALQNLKAALPENEPMSTAIFMGMVELMKGAAVGTQKFYSGRVFTQLRNIRELTRGAEAVRNGELTLDELNDAVDMLQRPENAFNNIRLVENAPVINNARPAIREVVAEFPPRDAATNADWQEFLRATNRTGQVFEPMADPMDPAFDMTVEQANEFSQNLQEWMRFQQKNIYRDMIRENPNLTFEEANVLQTGRHTAREETWAEEWSLAEDEYVMNELDRLLAEPDEQPGTVEIPEGRALETGGEPPVWELEAPPPEMEVPMVDNIARAELENVLAGEVLAGMSALVPIGQVRMDSNERRNYTQEVEWFESQERDRQRQLATKYNNQEVYVRMGGGWYRGVASDTDLLWHQRDQAYTNVTLTDLNNRVVSIPLQQQYIRLASEFQPERIATYTPYGGEEINTEPQFRFQTNLNQFESLDDMVNQNVFVKLDDGWHRGTIEDMQLVPMRDGANPIMGAAVRIPFKTVGGRQDTVLRYIPVNASLLQFDDGEWSPENVSFWEPGTDPTEVFRTDNMHIEDHMGEQVYADGVWRTLQTIRPAAGYPNNKTLVFADGTTYVLKGRAQVQVRLYGEVDQAPQTVLAEVVNENRPPENPGTKPLTKDPLDLGLADIVNENRPPVNPGTNPLTRNTGQITRRQYRDDQNVMSYLKREHNEVYTIWKNPAYTGKDQNRVERIFGGVVPFMSYNSEGHPILTNDQELDHHGHTEFNMVHVSSLELQEMAAGQVDNTNTADIQQTNVEADPVNET